MAEHSVTSLPPAACNSHYRSLVSQDYSRLVTVANPGASRITPFADGDPTGHSPPGKEVALPPPPPLRTVRDSFPSYGSSLLQRPSRDAAMLHDLKPAWICR